VGCFELSRPVEADNQIFGNERNEHKVCKRYRNDDHSRPSCLLEFHAATSLPSAPIVPLIPPSSKRVAIHAVHYNFAKIHKSLRITLAMAAGLSDYVWSLKEIALLAH
jgi:hypothetical protein